MYQDELDLLDREISISDAFQAAIARMDNEQNDGLELLDFLAEEYRRTRETLMALVAERLQQLRS